MSRLTLGCLALLTLVAAAACPGDGSEIVDDMMNGPECGDGILDREEECDDGNLVDGDDCSSECIDETATLAYIQSNIFSPICTPGCHVVGGIAPMSLETEALSFQNMVNVRSVEISSLFLVEPGNSDNSYLVWKIEGRPSILGFQMPLGQPPLTQDQMDSIINWIDNGANP